MQRLLVQVTESKLGKRGSTDENLSGNVGEGSATKVNIVVLYFYCIVVFYLTYFCRVYAFFANGTCRNCDLVIRLSYIDLISRLSRLCIARLVVE